MKQLVIFRGPSGSGKSTAARHFLQQSCGHSGALQHFEADNFFMEDDGSYNFNARQLGQAHNWCQCLVHDAMAEGLSPVVVSNTSMTKWEVEPYLEFAEQHGYEVVVYKIKGPWDAELFASRNAHNVPLSVVQKQISKYQPIEGEIEYE